MNAALTLAIGVVALLYASVGHAGATGYIAVMTLFGIAPDVMRPTALVLNVVVATIASVQFFRAGHFHGSLLRPLVLTSVPCAAIGGALHLPTTAFEKLVGLVLVVSTAKLLFDALSSGTTAGEEPPSPTRLSATFLAALGGGIGLVSGLTGVGGGVFLAPVLLGLRAAAVKQVAAVTAPFILVNSLAGLAGGVVAGRSIPAVSLPVLAAAVVGGTIGAELGAFRLPGRMVRLLLAAVLAVASFKLLVH